jgi:hypothetical protein
MLHIMVVCARTGTFVSTGIETDLETFAALPETLSVTNCPACGKAHYWTKSETWICQGDSKLQADVLPRN